MVVSFTLWQINSTNFLTNQGNEALLLSQIKIHNLPKVRKMIKVTYPILVKMSSYLIKFDKNPDLIL